MEINFLPSEISLNIANMRRGIKFKLLIVTKYPKSSPKLVKYLTITKLNVNKGCNVFGNVTEDKTMTLTTITVILIFSFFLFLIPTITW